MLSGTLIASRQTTDEVLSENGMISGGTLMTVSLQLPLHATCYEALGKGLEGGLLTTVSPASCTRRRLRVQRRRVHRAFSDQSSWRKIG